MDILTSVIFTRTVAKMTPDERDWIQLALHVIANEIEKGGHLNTKIIDIGPRTGGSGETDLAT